MLAQIIAASLIMTTPILLAAIGGLVNRRAGIVNIGLEGMMLAGAFVAILVSAATGSWLAGVLAAAVASAVVGYLFALAITRAAANMIVAGLGLNILMAGVIGFVLSWFYNSSGTLRLAGVSLLPDVLPGSFSEIPVIGEALSELDPLTVFAWASVLVLPYLLANTRTGLRLRATGNSSAVVRSVGLSPMGLQEFSTAFAGFYSGLAGAHLALASIGLFNEGLTAGRGFIALAAFYFGRDRPWPTALVCLLFGLLDAAQIRMQTSGLPPKLISTIPYLMVLLALCLAGIRKHRKEARA